MRSVPLFLPLIIAKNRSEQIGRGNTYLCPPSNQDNTSTPVNFSLVRINTAPQTLTKHVLQAIQRVRKDFKKILQDPTADTSEDAIIGVDEGEEDLLGDDSVAGTKKTTFLVRSHQW